MTANAMQGDRELCIHAGMDDYLTKPIQVEELVKALGKCQPIEGLEANTVQLRNVVETVLNKNQKSNPGLRLPTPPLFVIYR